MLKTALTIFSITCTLTIAAQVIDYAIDPGFNSGLLFNSGGPSDILVNGDGDYVIIGRFNNITSPVFNSALISSNGELIDAANFAGQKVDNYKGDYLQYGHSIHRYTIPIEPLNNQFVFEYHKPEYSGFLTGNALDVLILPEDLILVAGRYFTDTTTTVESLRHLCLIDSTGSPIEGFPMVHCAQPIDAEIYAIDSLSDGSYIIAGRFSEVNGHPCNNVARLNPDFSVDTQFENSLVFRSWARVKLIDSQDRIWITIPYGGLITTPEDTTRTIRLLANGTVDPEFLIPECKQEINDITYETYPTGFLEEEDGSFVVYGFFTKYNGVSVKGLIKINDNGSLIAGAFNGMGADEAVWGTWVAFSGAGFTSIEKLPNGNLLLGGQFSSFGGEPYSCLVRLQPNGTVGTKDLASPRTKVKVYPNPANTYIEFEYKVLIPAKETVLRIIDVQGKPIQTWNLGIDQEGIRVLDTRKMLNGVYFYDLMQGGEKVKSGKFIIQH